MNEQQRDLSSLTLLGNQGTTYNYSYDPSV
ncbi:NADPH-dependent 7-cyano-7-deazaguanine reductase QueF, partial [Mesorhizobium sp. M00.F.Ca.ET.186.01.1.1]